MPNAHDVEPTIFYLLLKSVLSARWGLSATVRPRARSHERPLRALPSAHELADFVWITFSDEMSQHAVGIGLRPSPPLASRAFRRVAADRHFETF